MLKSAIVAIVLGAVLLVVGEKWLEWAVYTAQDLLVPILFMLIGSVFLGIGIVKLIRVSDWEQKQK